MRKLAPVALLLLLVAACIKNDQAPGEKAFPPLFTDRAVFRTAIGACRGKPLPQKISGVTVPHHLLAADLMAEAFSRLQGQDYQRLVILSPDHFNRSHTAFAVTRRNFETVLGRLTNDQAAVNHLLKNPLVSESSLFSQEHGVQALLPFIAHYCPQAQIVPLAIRRTSGPADWDSLAQSLAPLLGPGTLVVQSTDFSHYLPHREARRRDQETLRVLSGGDPKAVLALTEPAHLDSRACQYLQLRLQQEVFRAGLTILANRNSQEYTAEPLKKTTSYVVQIYSAEPVSVEGTQSYFFGGDTFFGRGVAKKLASPERRQYVVQQVREITRGKPLIVNLEGVLTDKRPESVGPYTLWMEAALAFPLLQSLNVRAVSLANNHSRDLGEDSYREMTRFLAHQGIACLENGRVLDLGDFYLAAFTDLNNQSEEKVAQLTREDLKCFGQVKKDKPLFAFLHWGREFGNQAGPREQALTDLLEEMGVEVIIGCHSHRAGSLLGTRKSCRVFSLGNFVFDQDRARTSGILLEAVFFPQGTYFLKVHPVNNLISGTR
jgi:AmmeMemoRadiSam system protein B